MSTTITETVAPVVPTLGRIVRHSGVAGQFALSTSVTYPGERASVVTFTHSAFGGPIVMVTPTWQLIVSREVTDRLGSQLTPEWVRTFFS